MLSEVEASLPRKYPVKLAILPTSSRPASLFSPNLEIGAGLFSMCRSMPQLNQKENNLVSKR